MAEKSSIMVMITGAEAVARVILVSAAVAVAILAAAGITISVC